jgi:hypothetical protein
VLRSVTLFFYFFKIDNEFIETMPLELEDVIVSEPGVEDDQDHEFSEMVASNQTLPASRSSNVLNRNISNQNRNNDDDLDTSFNTQLNINRDAPNNEIVAPNRDRSVSPLADLESNRSSTVEYLI